MKTVLITGLDGFTGRYVQAELENDGYKVVGLSSDLTDLKALSAEIEPVTSATELPQIHRKTP